MPRPTRACKRCHNKKIRCDTSKPSCRPCTDAEVVCVPHERVRRALYPRGSDIVQSRVGWLEEGLSQQLGINVRALETGSDLQQYFKSTEVSEDRDSTKTPGGIRSAISHIPKPEARLSPHNPHSEEISIDVAPDISLLTLNAMGEMRYLGPSSGSFFSKYASNFARASTFSTATLSETSQLHSVGARNHYSERSTIDPSLVNIASLLTPNLGKKFLRLYFKWVHTVWPLFDDDYRVIVLEPLSDPGMREVCASGTYVQQVSLITYYLVIALGAIHMTSEDRDDDMEAYQDQEYQRRKSKDALSSDMIFVKAVETMDAMSETLQPSISMIRILLLICIYGAYKPSGNRQWQLAGIAIRTAVEIGLHRQRSGWEFSPDELDVRRRVFWTAYAVELTTAFNLGRPPSIPDEHIDAEFPKETPEIALAVHHIRHRQIQSKILCQIYCAPHKLKTLTEAEKLDLVSKMQDSLDDWKATLLNIYEKSHSPYPCQYWERFYYATTAAIHRPTPLMSTPSPESANRCLSAAGRYVEIHHSLLKSDRIPQSWMLLQGMLLAGVTVMITARTNRRLFPDRIRCTIFEIMEWNRKCSAVLNIMSERWSDKSISNLEAKFSVLANDTLKLLIAPRVGVSEQTPSTSVTEERLMPSYSESITVNGTQYQTPNIEDIFQGDRTHEDMDIIDELSFRAFDYGLVDPLPLETFYGNDDLYTLWGIFPHQDDMSS